MSIFSDNIRLLRTERSLTQRQLADDLIITRDRLSSYETGRCEPPFEILNRISIYFNTSLDTLINARLPIDRENILELGLVDKHEGRREFVQLRNELKRLSGKMPIRKAFPIISDCFENLDLLLY